MAGSSSSPSSASASSAGPGGRHQHAADAGDDEVRHGVHGGRHHGQPAPHRLDDRARAAPRSGCSSRTRRRPAAGRATSRRSPTSRTRSRSPRRSELVADLGRAAGRRPPRRPPRRGAAGTATRPHEVLRRLLEVHPADGADDRHVVAADRAGRGRRPGSAGRRSTTRPSTTGGWSAASPGGPARGAAPRSRRRCRWPGPRRCTAASRRSTATYAARRPGSGTGGTGSRGRCARSAGRRHGAPPSGPIAPALALWVCTTSNCRCVNSSPQARERDPVVARRESARPASARPRPPWPASAAGRRAGRPRR